MARKAKSDAEKIAAMLGIAPPDNEVEIQQARSEEAVLAYVKGPELFKRVTCPNCHREFAVNRANVSCCSTRCRRAELHKIGIETQPENEPRHVEDYEWAWRVYWGREPLIVTPKALVALDEAQAIQESLSFNKVIVVEAQMNPIEQPLSLQENTITDLNRNGLDMLADLGIDDMLNR